VSKEVVLSTVYKKLATWVVLFVSITNFSIFVEAKEPLVIKVVGEDVWGDVAVPDIAAVLTSTAETLWEYAGPEVLRPILVMRSKSGPIVLFKRGPRGEYFVKLNTGDRYWCQYAFQFAHEFGHILCRYKDGDATNKWFEETICEVASLFALRAMAVIWEDYPPYPNWSGYSKHLRQYAKERIDRYKLPKDVHLSSYYAENAVYLKTHATDRSRNTSVAIELLPLFEENPEGWKAIHYLNESVWEEEQDFPTHLRNWYRHTPDDLKPFVQKVGDAFGIRVDVKKEEPVAQATEPETNS
jgi:hypothetical protein